MTFIDSKAEMADHCITLLRSAVTFGYGLLVVVPTEWDILVLHLFNFKASEDLLEVHHNVWEGWTQFRVHLGGGEKRNTEKDEIYIQEHGAEAGKDCTHQIIIREKENLHQQVYLPF